MGIKPYSANKVWYSIRVNTNTTFRPDPNPLDRLIRDKYLQIALNFSEYSKTSEVKIVGIKPHCEHSSYYPIQDDATHKASKYTLKRQVERWYMNIQTIYVSISKQ